MKNKDQCEMSAEDIEAVAITLAISVFDDQLSSKTRLTSMQTVERFLKEQPFLKDLLRARFLGRLLPIDADVNTTVKLMSRAKAPMLKNIYNEIFLSQGMIKRLRDAWHRVSHGMYKDDALDQKESIELLMIHAGIFGEMVEALMQDGTGGLDRIFLTYSTNPNIEKLIPGCTEIIWKIREELKQEDQKGRLYI